MDSLDLTTTDLRVTWAASLGICNDTPSLPYVSIWEVESVPESAVSWRKSFCTDRAKDGSRDSMIVAYTAPGQFRRSCDMKETMLAH